MKLVHFLKLHDNVHYFGRGDNGDEYFKVVKLFDERAERTF